MYYMLAGKPAQAPTIASGQATESRDRSVAAPGCASA